MSDQSSMKKIPVVRETKMKAIRAKLCGLLIEGALEPAHCLLDITANMHQINEVRYIAPERCVSRSHEVLTSKTPSKQPDISAESLVKLFKKKRMCQTWQPLQPCRCMRRSNVGTLP